MKVSLILVYPLEFVAAILFVLTLVGIIENVALMFYFICFMGLLMSALSGMRDAPKSDKESLSPMDYLPRYAVLILYGLGALAVLTFLVSFLFLIVNIFFPPVALLLYRLALVVIFSVIVMKWVVVHSSKLYLFISSRGTGENVS